MTFISRRRGPHSEDCSSLSGSVVTSIKGLCLLQAVTDADHLFRSECENKIEYEYDFQISNKPGSLKEQYPGFK